MTADWEPGHRAPVFPDEEPAGPDGPAGGPARRDGGDGLDSGRLAWLVGGALAIAAGTALGWDPAALAVVVTPPPFLRAALVGGAVAVGVVLLVGALARLGADDRAIDTTGRPIGPARPDIATMIRGVRLVFLAVAAFAAASGWLLGHPLPLVVALVIAGVDVLETSFLLIVVSLRSRD